MPVNETALIADEEMPDPRGGGMGGGNQTNIRSGSTSFPLAARNGERSCGDRDHADWVFFPDWHALTLGRAPELAILSRWRSSLAPRPSWSINNRAEAAS